MKLSDKGRSWKKVSEGKVYKVKIGFIGLGNMAGAMIGGFLKEQVVQKSEILGFDLQKELRDKRSEEYGIQICENNVEVAQQSEILFLAVKPQYYEVVITQIREFVREQTIIVTIAPGKTTKWVEEQFQKTVKVIRCMPNTPALVLEGCTGVCKNAKVESSEFESVLKLLSCFGLAKEVEEHLMNTVVGVSGSAPAYGFILIEAMADAAVLYGMPRAMAYEFAAQAILGSAKMVLETKKHPGELKDMVCSPGGTTIEAVKVLEREGFRSAMIEAMSVCIEKSQKM